MSRYNKFFAALFGTSTSGTLCVIFLWWLNSPDYINAGMPDIVQNAATGLVTSIFGALVTLLGPPNT